MHEVRVLREVIASPGDVKAEREIIPDIIEEVNRNIARPRRTLPQGKLNRAIECHESSLSIAREICDRQGEGFALWNLSLVSNKVGDKRLAIENEDPNAESVQKKLDEWRLAISLNS